MINDSFDVDSGIPTRITFCPIGDAPHRAALRELLAYTAQSAQDTNIELLAVIQEPSTWDRLAHPGHVDAVIDEQTAEWTKTLGRWREEFDAVDQFGVMVGPQADTITRHALIEGAHLIVLSAGHDPHDKAVVRRVMRNAECPVWLLRPTRAKTHRIMAAVNPEPDELDLNLAILANAERLTETLGGELSLLSAWELYGEQTMRSSAFVHTPLKQYHDFFDLREDMTVRGLMELALAANLSIDYELIIENGAAVPTILQTIRKRRINLLVIGTVGRSGLSGLLLGNTAESLANSASCSVYAIKPPGFASPLR